jgi:hypothetical protein
MEHCTELVYTFRTRFFKGRITNHYEPHKYCAGICSGLATYWCFIKHKYSFFIVHQCNQVLHFLIICQYLHRTPTSTVIIKT